MAAFARIAFSTDFLSWRCEPLFLKKHAFKSAQFGAMRREDVWSIPLTILREAIVNALVHSDYSQRGTPIRIAFFDQVRGKPRPFPGEG